MGLVIIAAFWCAFWAYSQRWEASSDHHAYQQRYITRSVMLEAQQDMVAAGHSAPEICNETSIRNHTRRTGRNGSRGRRLHKGQKLFLIRRANVSGDNGWFSLHPIVVETYGSPLDAPWLDRLRFGPIARKGGVLHRLPPDSRE